MEYQPVQQEYLQYNSGDVPVGTDSVTNVTPSSTDVTGVIANYEQIPTRSENTSAIPYTVNKRKARAPRKKTETSSVGAFVGGPDSLPMERPIEVPEGVNAKEFLDRMREEEKKYDDGKPKTRAEQYEILDKIRETLVPPVQQYPKLINDNVAGEPVKIPTQEGDEEKYRTQTEISKRSHDIVKDRLAPFRDFLSHNYKLAAIQNNIRRIYNISARISKWNRRFLSGGGSTM